MNSAKIGKHQGKGYNKQINVVGYKIILKR